MSLFNNLRNEHEEAQELASSLKQKLGYAQEIQRQLNATTDYMQAVYIATNELNTHGHPNPAAWAVHDWLAAYGYEISLDRISWLWDAPVLEGEPKNV
jgi:hypothetical protein